MARQSRISLFVLGFSFAFAFAILVPGLVEASPQTSGSTQSSPKVKPPQPMSDQMTNIPYYTLQDGMSSTLLLNNTGPSAVTVSVTLYNLEGRAQSLPPVTLDHASFKEINLADVVTRQDFDSGNVQVSYNGISMAVTCQVGIISLDRRVSFESREQDMMDFESSSLNGILWLPQKDADGFLALTNVSKNKVAIKLTVGSKTKDISLYGRETKLVKLNEEFGQQAPGAALVSLQHDGLPGDVITQGFVLSAKSGYSSSFAMVDPKIMRSSHLSGVGFRFGSPDSSLGFPTGTSFSSPLLLANVTDKPVTAHVSVDHTVEGKLQMTPIDPKNSGSEEKFSTEAVGDLTIPAKQIRQIELSDAMAKLNVAVPVEEAGVDISYEGAPGSLIGHLVSVDQTGDYSFEVPVKDAMAMNEMMEGLYPWTLDNGADTILHLKNTTDKVVNAYFLLRFEAAIGDVYNPDQIRLQPYQSIAIDVQKLKDANKPDVRGRHFPTTATHGQVEWRQNTPFSMIGRAEQSNVGEGIARSFSCGYNCCDNWSTGSSISPASLMGDVGNSDDLTVYVGGSGCDGSPWGPLLADGTWATVNSWSSDDPSVATVSGSGDEATVTYGPYGGATNVRASITDRYYDYDVRGICTTQYAADPQRAQVNVPYPTFFHQVGSGSDIGNGTLQFSYAWSSSTGNTSDLSGCVVGESVSYPGDPAAFSQPTPFPAFTIDPNPFEAQVNGASAGFGDNQKSSEPPPGTFRTPYFANSFPAYQYYRYKCGNQSQWTILSGPITINRAVDQHTGGGSWYYTVTKSGASAAIDPLP